MEQDGLWHLKLLVVLHLGLSTGVYKDKESMPPFRAQGAKRPDMEEKAEAEAVVPTLS